MLLVSTLIAIIFSIEILQNEIVDASIKIAGIPLSIIRIVVTIFYPKKDDTDIPLKYGHNLPNKNKNFTGRRAILKEIRKNFKKNKLITNTQAIHALGGVGKTQVALEYAYRYKNKYDCIWWVNAETEESILASFQRFASENDIISEEVRESDIIIERVRNWLQQHNNWLFIYDNADEFEKKEGRKFQDYLPQENTKRRHVLISSRSKNWTHLATPIKLDNFSPEEAAEFLTRKTGLPRNNSQDVLAEKLCYIALALAQAGAYIGNSDNNCDYEEYLGFLEGYNLDVLKKSSDEITWQSVHATWDISCKKISKESKELLNLCSFFAPENIDSNWFPEAREALPESLCDMVSNKLEYKGLLTELTKYSFVELKGVFLNMHCLVQEVICDNLKEEQATWQNYCIDIMNGFRYSNFSTAKSRKKFHALVPHIDSVIKGINDDEASLEVSQLYFFLGKGFNELADYPKSLKYNERASTIYNKFLGKEHPDTAATYNNMAEVCKNKGDYDLALEWNNKALTIQEKVLGKEHPDTGSTYNNIALAYYAKEDYDLALKYYLKALPIDKEVLGDEHRYTKNCLENTKIAYKASGKSKPFEEWLGENGIEL